MIRKNLKIVVTGKAKTARYKDALDTLQRKFGQPHASAGAHLDKLSILPPIKMNNSESGLVAGLVAVFISLSFNDDLNSGNLLDQAVSKLPSKHKET